MAHPTNTSTMSRRGMYMVILLMVFDWENFCSFLRYLQKFRKCPVIGSPALLNRHVPRPKFSMRNFSPSPTHIPNIIKVGHTVPEICSGQKITDGGRRTDIWITGTKSLPELSSGETKRWAW